MRGRLWEAVKMSEPANKFVVSLGLVPLCAVMVRVTLTDLPQVLFR